MTGAAELIMKACQEIIGPSASQQIGPHQPVQGAQTPGSHETQVADQQKTIF